MKKMLLILVILLVTTFPAVAETDAPPAVFDDVTNAILASVAIAIPLITSITALVKFIVPQVPPVFTRLALSVIAYIVVVHLWYEVPFEGLNTLVIALASIIGIDIGAGGVYQLAKTVNTPLIGTPRIDD